VIDSKKTSSRGTRWLAIGAICGAVLAATGLLEKVGTSLSSELLAEVNESNISKKDYLGYLELLARDKRNPMRDEDRRHVLNRLIEEQLLIERGLELGLPTSDPTVRKAIISAMIQSVISDTATDEPAAEALEEFYQQNSDYFAKPSRIQVQRMVFRDQNKEQSYHRAQQAHLALQNSSFVEVKQRLADRDILSLPNTLLPINKLRGYIGPSLTKQALAMRQNSYSPPIEDGSGYTILWLLTLQKSESMPLGEIRDQVIREYQRRQGDQALKVYLSELREDANIVIDEDFLKNLSSGDTQQ